jgi:hypothetical protein
MFRGTMDHLVQQQESRFRHLAKVTSGCTGKSSAHRSLDKTEMKDVLGRLQKTQGEEAVFDHRYLFPRKAELATLIDEDDANALDLSVAFTGDIGQQHFYAAERKQDRIFLSGIAGPMLEGQEENMQTVVVPASQIVAVNYGGANTGLTLDKLIRAKGRFGVNEVYGQNRKNAGTKLCMAVSQSDLNFLLKNVQEVRNADYAAVKALVDGEVNYFMGIEFTRSEQVTRSAPNAGKVTNTLPMWVTDGVYMDFWRELTTSIDVLPQQSQAIQVYSRLRCAAGRKDEKSVVLLNCEVNEEDTI